MPTPPPTELALDPIADRIATRSGAAADPASWLPFRARLDQHLPTLIRELSAVYGARRDFTDTLVELGSTAYGAWRERPSALKALDLQREADPHWFQSERMLGGVCYVDRFAGDLASLQAQIPYFQQLGLSYLHLMPLFECPQPNSDGGYAVSSYRAVDARLGDIEDLRALASALREAGISLVLDFIFNHTSDEHAWAKATVAGEAAHADFYFIYPDRSQPDAFERTVREIFPDEHPGAFSRLGDGRWVWTTFHSFQWDLNYRNPAVFVAMAGEMLSIANLGAEILRMDAVAFIWKELGTSCENLPQAHNLIRAFNAVARVAAPSLLFKSEAIVHPDDVIKYISPGECQLSYNPLQMALLWNTLATREVNLLQQALEERHALPPGTAWVNYVRSHDDIGWTFADEDAIRLGIKGFDHRQFLNRFYVNRFEGSFARGVPFQDNPLTGDCRICGTCASLCGMEQGDRFAAARVLLLHSVILSSGGMPLLYLGDEVGTLNDYSYLDNPAEAGDSRWVHRPKRDAAQHGRPPAGDTAAGTILEGLRRMVSVRRSQAVFAGGALIGFRSGNAAVLGYSRQGSGPSPGVLVLCNFSESVQTIDSSVLVALPDVMTDLLSGTAKPLRTGLRLEPYEVLWLE